MVNLINMRFCLSLNHKPTKTNKNTPRSLVFWGAEDPEGPLRSAMSQSGGDFSLSDEILAVIPTDPYDQLDLARKITSMAIASRVSNLESQVSSLTQKLLEKDRLVHELQGRVSSLERLYQESDSTLKNLFDENVRIPLNFVHLV